jgi:hypothetical protein
VDDCTLLAQFGSTELPLDQWNHRLHVRIVFLHLLESPFSEALANFRAALRSYNEAHSVPDHLASGYHETLTVAWFALIAARFAQSREITDSNSFCGAFPELLDRALLRRFYSADRITTWMAKREFVPPDLEALPESGAA